MRGGQSSLANLGLRLGESVEFPVRGQCMPALEGRSSLSVHRKRLYWPGDVVVIRRRDHWNVHRFLGYAPSPQGLRVLTAADDSSVRDPAAVLNAIVGCADCRVSSRERFDALRKYARALILRVAEERQ